MEGAVVSFMVFATQAKVLGKVGPVKMDEWMHPALHALVIITVPSYILWYTLCMLYTMPGCGDADPSMDTPDRVRRAGLIDLLGDILGHLLLITMFALTVRYYIFHPEGLPTKAFIIEVLIGRCYGYLLQWLTMLCVYFNPVLMIGSADPEDVSLFSYMCDRAGVGQWSREKERFQQKCAEVLRTQSEVRSSFREKPPSSRCSWANWFFCCASGGGKVMEHTEIIEDPDPEASANLLDLPSHQFGML